MIELVVESGQEPISLQRFLAEKLARDHRLIRQWIEAGQVKVDGQLVKATRRIASGQRITIDPPKPSPHPAQPENLPLPIRYSDADLVVVAKPAGMASHPGPGWWHGSCVNALLYAIADWPGIGGVAGPGIVHRLDRDTSGLLIFARSESAHRKLLDDLQAHRIRRRYLAWVVGELAGEGSIDLPLGRDPDAPQRMAIRTDGKPALTHYRVLSSQGGQSLLELELATGRQHQIRVHLAQLGHPIWGDPVYGVAAAFMALHAAELEFNHPISGEALSFREPPPAAWRVLGQIPAWAKGL